MIKINLLGEVSVTSSSKRRGLLLLYISLGVVFGVFLLLNRWVQSSISYETSMIQENELKLKRLQAVTAEVRSLEKMRDEISNKLAVIATLKKSKSGPVRVLDDLNNALPEKAWLMDLSEKQGFFVISGIALDELTIAEFIQALQKSDYFISVDLDETKKVEKDGVDVKQFTLRCKLSYAGAIGKRLLKVAKTTESDSKNPKKS